MKKAVYTKVVRAKRLPEKITFRCSNIAKFKDLTSFECKFIFLGVEKLGWLIWLSLWSRLWSSYSSGLSLHVPIKTSTMNDWIYELQKSDLAHSHIDSKE